MLYFTLYYRREIPAIVVQIAAGSFHSLALLSNGEVWSRGLAGR